MSMSLREALGLVMLTLAYRLVDGCVRRHGWARVFARCGSWGADAARLAWLVPCAIATPLWDWPDASATGALGALSGVLCGMLAWSVATLDVDVVAGRAHYGYRVALVIFAAAAFYSPAAALGALYLLADPFAHWEHHATLPMRVLQALAAHLLLGAVAALSLLAAVPWPEAANAVRALAPDPGVLWFFIVVIVVSHYLITALAKGFIGPRWYSWVTQNRLHYLAASAYAWGWARFLPWATWLRVIRAVQHLERPLQALAFGVELASPLALLDSRAAVAFCGAWAAFHCGVFALSGLLFWEWVVADLTLGVCLWVLPASIADRAFGIVPLAVGLVVLVLFPLRHKLWTPMPLGWFDTPFTQRVHWHLIAASGRVYGLYNDFMCPHERLYGKVHGCFLAPARVLTYHLGEAWKLELRDALVAAGPSLERLEPVRARFGISAESPELAARHGDYLARFFHELARGARKHVLPRGLRWLKAPGGQIFHWGELPAYRGQEPIVEIRWVYREEFFDGERLCRLRDEVVSSIRLPASPLPSPAREPTPKELDDFLLARAAGRLIDLPGFGGGYVRSDDGRQPAAKAAR